MSATIEEAVVARLLAVSGVTDLASSRIGPPPLDQDATLPAIVYQRISSNRTLALDGPTGKGEARIQLTCWAETYPAAVALGNAARIALNGYRGTVTVAGGETLAVQGILVEGPEDMPEPSAGLKQRRRYGRRLDALCHFPEAAS